MENQTYGGPNWCWLDLCATASSTRLIIFISIFYFCPSSETQDPKTSYGNIHHSPNSSSWWYTKCFVCLSIFPSSMDFFIHMNTGQMPRHFYLIHEFMPQHWPCCTIAQWVSLTTLWYFSLLCVNAMTRYCDVPGSPCLSKTGPMYGPYGLSWTTQVLEEDSKVQLGMNH